MLIYLAHVFGYKITTEVYGQKMVVVVEGRLPLYYSEGYEAHVTSFFHSLLKKGMRFADVGSSLGY